MLKTFLKRSLVFGHSYGMLSEAAVAWAFHRYGLRYA